MEISGQELDEEGNIIVEFEEQLQEINSLDKSSFEIIDSITKADVESWFKAVNFETEPLENLTSDQRISSALLENGLSGVKLPLYWTLDQILLYYSDHKELLDEQFDQSMNFNYEVLDSFEESGNKISSLFHQ